MSDGTEGGKTAGGDGQSSGGSGSSGSGEGSQSSSSSSGESSQSSSSSSSGESSQSSSSSSSGQGSQSSGSDNQTRGDTSTEGDSQPKGDPKPADNNNDTSTSDNDQTGDRAGSGSNLQSGTPTGFGSGVKSNNALSSSTTKENSAPQDGNKQQGGHPYDNAVIEKSPMPDINTPSLRAAVADLRDTGKQGYQNADDARGVSHDMAQALGGEPGDQLQQNLNKTVEQGTMFGDAANRLADYVEHGAAVGDAAIKGRQDDLAQDRALYDMAPELAGSVPEGKLIQANMIENGAARGQQMNQQAAAAMHNKADGGIWDILDPRNKGPVYDRFNKTVVEPLADAKRSLDEKLDWLYSEKSEGPTDVTVTPNGPDFDVKADPKDGIKPELKVLSVDGKKLYNHGTFEAFGGALKGTQEEGVFASFGGATPLGGANPLSVELQAGKKLTLDKIPLVEAGPVKTSIQPELRIGPGVSAELDLNALKEGFSNGHLNLKGKIPVITPIAPVIGGSLGFDTDIDFKAVGNWLVDQAREITENGGYRTP
ncbi:hypothetical protein [Amycolatopsis nigrescens]|uniref:hypothetical protein n=1 Tax=Amycolatopsis nigrescens TaxID=381445 RepID=UPI000374D1D1|nr:hypothetical protein [Amycolatopsis nigrescens]